MAAPFTLLPVYKIQTRTAQTLEEFLMWSFSSRPSSLHLFLLNCYSRNHRVFYMFGIVWQYTLSAFACTEYAIRCQLCLLSKPKPYTLFNQFTPLPIAKVVPAPCRRTDNNQKYIIIRRHNHIMFQLCSFDTSPYPHAMTSP